MNYKYKIIQDALSIRILPLETNENEVINWDILSVNVSNTGLNYLFTAHRYDDDPHRPGETKGAEMLKPTGRNSKDIPITIAGPFSYLFMDDKSMLRGNAEYNKIVKEQSYISKILNG